MYYTTRFVKCGEELLLDYRALPGTYGDDDATAKPKYRDPDAYFASQHQHMHQQHEHQQQQPVPAPASAANSSSSTR